MLQSVKSKHCNFPVSVNTWVFKNRIKRGFNIIVSKLPQVFMSDTSINRTYKQEMNFVFQDTWAERTRLWCVMERRSVEGQDTGSGVSKNGDHSRRMAAVRFYLLSRRQFSAHPKSSLARIDKRTARAARNTRYSYNKIGPLDHKMADNCVSLARTNTVSSTITKPIKT